MKILMIMGNIIIYVVVAIIVALPILFLSFLFIPPTMLYIIPLIIALYVFLLVLFTFKTFGLTKRPFGKKAFYGVTGVIVAVGLSFSISWLYKQSLDSVEDAEVDLQQYMPFEEGTRVVKLDKPTTLKIESNLPIIDGATALYPMYAAFAQAVYPKKSYPIYDSEVMSNMTHVAYENLIEGRVDLIFVAGPSADQIESAKLAGKELKLTPIGKEAFVFFVNSKNRVKGLTKDEIKGIYSGEIINWKEVGGKNKVIRAFQRPEGSGSQTALQNMMGDVPITDPPVENVIDLMGGIIDRVSAYTNYNNAIGFTFRYYSTEMVRNDKIRLLQVEGVEPTVDTIRRGDYPIASEFYAVTAGS
ncbi:PstS family phosphate ABC transporter substrate-binding protein, partial [Sporosarcina beigongshangi]|uniref:PstS family phosphate ABC transporter substrate-binding protein n=1 Tax=Sporosarcina beigongshangi TaxID=2782538 RepID=UPI002ACD7E83